MDAFGKKLAKCWKAKKLLQTDLAKQLKTSVSVISRYERDEMTPSVEAAKKIAKLINTTVGYLLGETNETNVLKDPDMLRRLNQISELPEEDKHCILYTLDGLLQNVKAKQAFNH